MIDTNDLLVPLLYISVGLQLNTRLKPSDSDGTLDFWRALLWPIAFGGNLMPKQFLPPR